VLKIAYANWLENTYNLRFLEALVEKYDVYAIFFDDQMDETFKRTRYTRFRVPSGIKKIEFQDPPVLPIPFDIRLAHHKGSAAWVFKMLARAVIFRKHIRNINPDLLIGHGISGTNPYGFCSALSGYHPFLAVVWGSDILVEARNSLIFRLIAKYVLNKADGVIVDSEVQKKAAMELGCNENKIWKFPWGIDLEDFNPDISGLETKRILGWENNKIIISNRSHFPVYGIEYLIGAIPIVVKEMPEARFLIIGDGPLTEALKKMTKRLGVTRYANFVGRVPNQQISRYLKAADIYVSTSFSDGTSASLLEAMACGLPVVVTDIPANNEWIQNGKNGFLVPIKDSKTLAEKIIFLAKNNNIRKFMGRSNVEVAKVKADWKQNVNVFYDAIQTLIADQGYCNKHGK
jgi:glycosyltransferase involved in cell wall biosynthesis